jgi:2-amino-4-hydroxy-6-hydroxymethyldihydropteridine diphosphokinase
MPTCLIGLGSNLGQRRRTLERALARLAQHPQLRLTDTSRWVETLPVGGPAAARAAYLNGAATIETSLEPEAVLAVLQGIEDALGRRRDERWGPRNIDLDLLLYDRRVLRTPSLTLPHPRMSWRRFVLEPAAEVAGSMLHPTTGWTVDRLLAHLDTAREYVAIAGGIGSGKTFLARRLAEALPAARWIAARWIAVRWIAERPDTERLERFYAEPAGNAWRTELEFLHERARLLADDDPRWSDAARPTVSDFWFDQSAAFARRWLPARRYREFLGLWQDARQGVVRPKLIVLLDVPADRMLERIRRRGRPYECSLEPKRLEQIHQAVLDQAEEPDQGPILRLTDEDPDTALAEVTAAMEAMRRIGE